MIELPGEQQSVEVIKKKYADILFAAERAWTIVCPLVQDGQSLAESGAHFWTRWVTLAYYARQLRSFRAVVLLLERGMVPEAQKILRTMLETLLHLDFLASAADQAKTSREYLLWELANDQKVAKILKLDDSPEHAARFKELEDALAAERNNQGEKWKTFVHRGPPLLTIEELAKRQGMGDWYDTVYRRTSGPIHGFNILTYSRPTPDGSGLNVYVAPDDKALEITMEAAISLLLETALRTDRVLKLGKEADLRKCDSELKSEWVKRKGSG